MPNRHNNAEQTRTGATKEMKYLRNTQRISESWAQEQLFLEETAEVRGGSGSIWETCAAGVPRAHRGSRHRR